MKVDFHEAHRRWCEAPVPADSQQEREVRGHLPGGAAAAAQGRQGLVGVEEEGKQTRARVFLFKDTGDEEDPLFHEETSEETFFLRVVCSTTIPRALKLFKQNGDGKNDTGAERSMRWIH